jgi:osmotically-inducible protein OsmY
MVAALVFMAFSAPAHAGKTDTRIEDSAKQSYVFKTYLQNDDIKISSKDGVVTMTGTVMEESHKSLALETVSGLPGVKSVNNKLEFKGEIPAKGSDAWITAKVKTTFLFHRSVSSATTEVSTKDGIVYLRGDTTSQAKKELATEYAKDVEGVKDVMNEMTVAQTTKKAPRTIGDKVDDSSITAQVKMTLLNHRSTSALYTSVKTKNGVVTVSGTAKNSSEKSLVSKLANDIPGVKSVKNKMIIE